MDYTDRILGGVMAGLGLLCLGEAYRIWNGWSGSGTMALIVGMIFVILSLVFLLFPPGKAAPKKWADKKELVRIGVISGFFALYIGLMEWLGYPLTTWLFMAGVTRYISRRRTFIILIWTGLVAIGTHIIFRRYLGMYLPSGFIGI